MLATPSSTTSYPPAVWRVLNTGWQDGPTNMAIDEAIMEAVAAGEQPPTLRFYGWEPACLSLGHAQPAAVVDWAACAEQGWDVVRRPTGGRAILHGDELTYSVCAPEVEARVQGGVLASYLRLSDALAVGLAQLGLASERAGPPGSATGGPVCFDTPSNYEITSGGRKLIGSAQARRRGMVLQHGTLPLYGDLRRIITALRFTAGESAAEAAEMLDNSATTLEASLGRRVAFEEVAVALAAGFAAALNLTLRAEPLSAAEQTRAAEIRAEKFAAASWTRRK